MMLIAASWPSNSAAAVNTRTGRDGTCNPSSDIDNLTNRRQILVGRPRSIATQRSERTPVTSFTTPEVEGTPMTTTDDLGSPFEHTGPAQRVVSLVPSLTESVAATRRDALVGATDWCTHPADLDIRRFRGTKNPDVAAIIALRPDVVLANKEENRRTDVQRLRAAGIPVWVTVIETVDQALASLRRMFEHALDWRAPGGRRCRPGLAHRRARQTASRGHPDLARSVDGCRIRNVHRRSRRPLRPDQRLRPARRPVPARQPRGHPGSQARPGPAARRALPLHRHGWGPRLSPAYRRCWSTRRGLTWYGPSLVTARDHLIASVTDRCDETSVHPQGAGLLIGRTSE